MELSVVVSNYENVDFLPNSFTSLSRQKTNFEWEVCFLDDCSCEDPKPFYDKYLTVKNKKGMRLRQHVGNLGINRSFDAHTWFKPGASIAVEMASADIIVIMHSDILILDDDALQKFYDRMQEKVLQIPKIWTRDVDKNMYLDFDTGIEKANTWNTTDMLYQDTVPPRPYQGPAFMPFYRKTLDEIKYHGNVHEIDLTREYAENGYTMEPSEIRAVHQKHRNIPNVFAINGQCLLHWHRDCPERIIW